MDAMVEECLQCGEAVSDKYAKVLGDNNDEVHGCPTCGRTNDARHKDGKQGITEGSRS